MANNLAGNWFPLTQKLTLLSDSNLDLLKSFPHLAVTASLMYPPTYLKLTMIYDVCVYKTSQIALLPEKAKKIINQ